MEECPLREENGLRDHLECNKAYCKQREEESTLSFVYALTISKQLLKYVVKDSTKGQNMHKRPLL